MMTMKSTLRSPPDRAEMQAAMRAAGVLERCVAAQQGARLRLVDDENDEMLELPASAIVVLYQALLATAAGRRVTLAQETQELSTHQAAEVLNVSRPFLIKLLEQGAIPYRRVGRHRRIRADDVAAYKAGIDREREAVLAALVRNAQEQGDGYP
jgi:excisionase family DNA binding protein